MNIQQITESHFKLIGAALDAVANDDKQELVDKLNEMFDVVKQTDEVMISQAHEIAKLKTEGLSIEQRVDIYRDAVTNWIKQRNEKDNNN